MAKVKSFLQVSLDGYFADENSDIEWAHSTDDPEFNAFVAENAQGGGTLLFGRVTYEMMVKYWPTPQAKKDAPKVAEGMNRAPKVVFSRTLEKSDWQNTKVVKGDLAKEVKKLKEDSDGDITILGSASIVAQLAEEGLVDEFQFVVNPILLGEGRTMFAGTKGPFELELTETRSFPNGVIVSSYAPSNGK